MSAETSNDRLFAKLAEEVACSFQDEPTAAKPQAVFDRATVVVEGRRFRFVQTLLPRTRHVSLARLQGVDLLAGGIANGEGGYRRILAATVAAAALERLQPSQP